MATRRGSRLPARVLREPNPKAGEVLTAIFCLLFWLISEDYFRRPLGTLEREVRSVVFAPLENSPRLAFCLDRLSRWDSCTSAGQTLCLFSC
jgi:hypothetical protein